MLTALKLCDDSVLIQSLCFWTLPLVLFFFFNFKHNVSATGLCLHPQVKPTQFGPIDRATLETGISFIVWAQLSRFYLTTETESSLRNLLNRKQDDGEYPKTRLLYGLDVLTAVCGCNPMKGCLSLLCFKLSPPPLWFPLEHGASIKLPVSLQFLNLGSQKDSLDE
jgi:hypothetical protein